MTNRSKLLSNSQFRWMAIAVGIVALIVLVVNLFVIGGDLFVYTFNSLLNSPLAILVTIFAAIAWRLMSKEKNNRYLWTGMLIGWAFWAIAETIWAVYSVLGQEVPYPSIADIFWVVGYIPMGVGLLIRALTMPARPTRFQYILIFGISLVTILVTAYFVFIPILQYFDPELLVISLLDLIYPLADLFLLMIVWRLLFSYEEGDYGFAWRVLTVGFLLMTISDFIFTYAVWQEIYYPDMEANAISRLAIDVPYTYSYLLWIVGIFALRILLKVEHHIKTDVRIRMVRPYGHLLMWTKSDDTVLNASSNFTRFFDFAELKGKSLAGVLSISEQEGRSILEKIRAGGKMADLPLQIPDRSGIQREAWLNGMKILDPQGQYSGSNFLLRIVVDDDSFDAPLSHETRLMMKSMLDRCSSYYQDEVKQFLLDYYLSYIRYILDMASSQGGEAMCQSLLDRLLDTAKKHGWQMQFNLHTILEGSDHSLAVLREALPVLLDAATKFISSVLDPVTVQTDLQEFKSQFGEDVIRDVAYFGKAGNDIKFADKEEFSGFRVER